MENLQTVTTSKQFSLNLQDLGKGLLVAALSAGLTALLAILNNGGFPTVQDLKTVGLVSVTAGISYLIKNFLQPAQTVIIPPVKES